LSMTSAHIRFRFVPWLFGAILLGFSTRVFGQQGYWLTNSDIYVCTYQNPDFATGVQAWAAELSTTQGIVLHIDDSQTPNRCDINVEDFDSNVNPQCPPYDDNTPRPYCATESGTFVGQDLIYDGGTMFMDTAFWANTSQWEREYAAAHEFGHNMGLAHNVNSPTMANVYPNAWNGIVQADNDYLNGWYSTCVSC